MSTLYIDCETYCDTPITDGTYKYNESSEVILITWALDQGPISIIDRTEDSRPSDALSVAIWQCDDICAHNSTFDRLHLTSLYHDLTCKPWHDTMVRALAHGLPGALGTLCEIFSIGTDKAKDKEGKKLIHLFCKPQTGRKIEIADRLTHPAEWAAFKRYAMQDIAAMRELDRLLPRWNDTPEERALWQLDQRINDRGYLIDLELAHKAIEAVAEHQKRNAQATNEATGGAVASATQRDAMLSYILAIHGVDLPDMQTATLTRRLEDPDLPEPVKELLWLRLASAGTSTAKYRRLIKSVSSDNRLRGTMQFCGAQRTGRWAGRIFQPQNLPSRTGLKEHEVELGIEAIKAGAVDLLFENPSLVASAALRGCIIAPEGKKLVISDLSAIEGRVLAWLAGEVWKVKAYRDLDAGRSRHDLYKLTYATTFTADPDSVTTYQRKLGKILELAMGFGGGVGSFVTFAKSSGVDLAEIAATVKLPDWAREGAAEWWEKTKKTYDLDRDVFIALDAIKRMWRSANGAIESIWRTLEDDVRGAIVQRKAVQRTHYAVDRKGSWLRIKLPSGRYLCYAGAEIDDENKIRYLGINQYTRKWCKLSTYGGKLAENITQATARDVLAHGMTQAEDSGYPVLLSVHDELITETPDDPQFSHVELSRLMSIVPPWAAWLPLDAKGFETYRYKKED